MAQGICRACRGSELRQFLDAGELPLAGGFLPGPEAISSERFFPLVIHICADCGLIQIVDPIDLDTLFKQYYFSSSTVGGLVAHFRDYAEFIATDLEAKSVVEFGCNDGILLEPLRQRGLACYGVDISENISEIARGKGLDVTTGHFDQATAKTLVERSGPVDLVTGSNCFAHNEDPDEILDAARVLLAPDGLLALEVMYAGDLLEQLQWDTLYHEHFSVYSLGSMATLLRRKGYSLVDVFHLPMHAGSLRVIASPNPDAPASDRVKAMMRAEEEAGLLQLETWLQFGKEVTHRIDIIGRTLRDLSANNRIWAYGASGRASMWLNSCRLDFVERIVDASPLRAGTLMPGTHTPVVLPEEFRNDPPDYVVVTAWNYFDTIRENESWFDGVWVTPLPHFEFF